MHHVDEQNWPQQRRLFAGDGQQLLRQCRSLLAREADFFHMLQQPASTFNPGRKQIAIQQDASQQVVEVVRNASRQSSDDFHFFCCPRFLGGTPGFRRVFQHGDQEDRFTPGIVHHRHRQLAPEIRPIFAAVATLLLEGVTCAPLQLREKCFVWLKIART